MTDPQRRVYTPDAGDVDVREVSDDDRDDGTWRLRAPATSTAEARDGEAFSREKVKGFAAQAEGTPVFLDHGRNENTGSRYSAAGRVGVIENPELRERDGVTDLLVDFVLMDPDELPEDAGWVREALTLIRAQAEAGMPITSSVGWSEDTGERDLPGDVDWLETSLVGIPSDARASTELASSEPALARAVSAASSDFDVETFVRELNRAEYDVDGETVDLTPPDAMQAAATVALAKDDEVDADCGTGVGSRRARQIASDEVGPDVVDEVAAYLTSHEEDVTAEGTPSEWSDEEWRDCGNLQYAKWGGTGGGTGLEWAQSKANEVAEARGEELPYPDRARNLDDPEFSEGDAVQWSSNDTPVHGRVADVGDEFEPAEGVTITGDEGEAVYLIHEYDDSLEPPQFRRENVAKPESSLSESTLDMPPAADDNFADSETTMTDSTEPGEESGTETDEQRADMQAMMEQMVDMQEEQTDMIREMYEDRMDGEDGDGEDDEGDDDEGMEESAADADESDTDERTVTLDGEERTVDEVKEEIADLRDQLDDADTEPETQDRAEDADADEADGEGRGGFGMAARME